MVKATAAAAVVHMLRLQHSVLVVVQLRSLHGGCNSLQLLQRLMLGVVWPALSSQLRFNACRISRRHAVWIWTA
jgi:hypothetical protein